MSAVKIKELIKRLEKKNQELEVEFIIVDTDDYMVCAEIEDKAKSMVKILKMFNYITLTDNN